MNHPLAGTCLAAAVALCPSLGMAGEIDMDREIRVQQVVPALVGDVWASWTTGEGFAAFAGAKATIELSPGGDFVIEWDESAEPGDRGSEGCEVLSFHHEKMLSFSWSAPPQFENVRQARTTVVIYFQAEGEDRTRVTLHHHGWPEAGADAEWDSVFEYFTKAWPSVLTWCAEHHAKAAGVEETPAAGSGWIYVPAPSREDFFEVESESDNQRIAEHFSYLVAAMKTGKLLFAGRSTDNVGPAAVIFEAKDEAEARAFMENDPAVKSGVFKATLHPMSFALLRGRDQR